MTFVNNLSNKLRKKERKKAQKFIEDIEEEFKDHIEECVHQLQATQSNLKHHNVKEQILLYLKYVFMRKDASKPRILHAQNQIGRRV